MRSPPSLSEETRLNARTWPQLLLAWHREHPRTLPWRGGSSAWGVLVSEVMLQQTQAGRVARAWPSFMVAGDHA